MKRKNMAAMVTSIALVGVVAVGGTLALLSQGSNTVNNTFTVGEGYTTNDIILSESDVKQNFDGSYVVNTDTKRGEVVYTALDGQKRYQTNSYTDLVTGTTIYKDPMVSIAANTPSSWVVAHIGQVDAALATSTFDADNTSWYQVKKENGKWTVAEKPVGTAENENAPSTIESDTYYIYEQVVTKQATVRELPELFTTLKVTATALDTGATSLSDMKVKAGLVQYVEGNDTVEELSNDELNVIMNAVESKLALSQQ